jgi:hypothetical protein
MAVKIIRVPKTPRSAFNTERPVSNLLKAQIANLEAAAYGSTREAAGKKRPRNEGQASQVIRALTAQLHPDGAASAAADAEARRLLQPPLKTPRPARASARRTAPKGARPNAPKRARRVGSKKR